MRRVIKFIRCYYYNMSRNELMLRAAALTYYAIFSIFPLLMLITSILGFFLRDPAKQQATLDALIGMIPEGAGIIADLLQNVSIGHALSNVIALLTLFWGGTGFLRGLLSAIDLIHSRSYTYSGLVMRGIGVVMILLAAPALFLLLFLSSMATLIVQFLPVDGPLGTVINIMASNFATFTIAALAFYLIMRYIPKRRPRRRIALTSALVTAGAWVGLDYWFSSYLSSGPAKFNVVYGSIGAVMALIFYLYMTNVIILLGAQLNALLVHFSRCRAPRISGLDDALKLLHLPLPALDESETPANKPTHTP